MSLPTYTSPDRILNNIQTAWSALLNPLLRNPLSNANLLTNIPLINGVTVVNHLLDRNQQGWIITDISAPATIYRSAPLNNKTLTLTSNAVTTVNILVY